MHKERLLKVGRIFSFPRIVCLSSVDLDDGDSGEKTNIPASWNVKEDEIFLFFISYTCWLLNLHILVYFCVFYFVFELILFSVFFLVD